MEFVGTTKPINGKNQLHYSDSDLREFEEIILKKLEKAEKDWQFYKRIVDHSDGNDTMDTSPTFKILEEGSATLSKEEAGRLAERQVKFISHLQAALIRIKNKSYGVCQDTGELIPKERLRVVPHTTRCFNSQKVKESHINRRFFN